LPELAEMLVGDFAAHGVEAEHLSDWTNTGEMTAVEALFVCRPRHAGRDLIVAAPLDLRGFTKGCSAR
jgi:hypothetical protein